MRPSLRHVLGVGLIGFGLVLAATGVFAAKPAPPPVGPVAGAPVAGPSAAPISDADRERAIRLATSSGDVRTLMAGHEFTVGQVARWTSESGEPVGASVQLRLAAPADLVDRAWVQRDRAAERSAGRSDNGPYVTRSQRLTVRNLRSAIVLVDLRNDSIVSVVPEPNGPSAGRLHVELPPGASAPAGAPEESEGGR